MDIITSSSVTASALNAEKMRLDVVSENIANANTTRGTDGKAYQRKSISFESVMDANSGTGVRVSNIKKDESPGAKINNPSHPHAGKDGMVEMPNVNVAYEMVDLISATRSYEANLAVFRNSRQMASSALSIGR